MHPIAAPKSQPQDPQPLPWLHVVLYQPEIPPNTGNVLRLCANTGAWLHLIRPLGFALDDRKLRRAGLDYRDLARLSVHDHLETLLAALPGRRLALTTKGSVSHTDWAFQASDVLLFGPESRGLPEPVLAAADALLHLPMTPGSRSLNLSNAVAVTVYEAWRQLGFPGAQHRRSSVKHTP